MLAIMPTTDVVKSRLAHCWRRCRAFVRERGPSGRSPGLGSALASARHARACQETLRNDKNRAALLMLRHGVILFVWDHPYPPRCASLYANQRSPIDYFPPFLQADDLRNALSLTLQNDHKKEYPE